MASESSFVRSPSPAPSSSPSGGWVEVDENPTSNLTTVDVFPTATADEPTATADEPTATATATGATATDGTTGEPPATPDPSSVSALRILSATDLASLLPSIPPSTLLSSQSAVFRAFSAQSPTIQTPQRISLTSDEQTVLFMPARAGDDMAVKIVSVPSGGSDGLPGSTVVLDAHSGKVKGMVNARLLTALRNAAGSALFLQEFPTAAPPTHLVIFGSGAQAEAHAALLLTLYPSFETCTIIVRSATPRAEGLISTLNPLFPNVAITLGVSSSAEFNLSQAVHNANVIVTATPSTAPLFNSVDVTSGTRVVCVGSYKPHMHEIQAELVHRAGLVVADSREACAIEAGELIAAGVPKDGMVELGEILTAYNDDPELQSTGEASEASNAKETCEALKAKVVQSGDIVLFKSVSCLKQGARLSVQVGIGIQDVAVAKLVLDEAEQRGVGTVIADYD